MEHTKTANGQPIRIGLYYLVWLVSAVILCLRCEPFARSAGKIKPYAVLFTRYIHRGLDSDTPVKIIYFGDSTLFFPPDKRAYEDDPYRHTPVLLQDVLSKQAPHMKIGVSEWAFSTASMYHYYCMFYKALDFSPQLLIIPINWNSFGLFWMSVLVKDDLRELSAFVPLFDETSFDVENPVRSKGISWIRQLRYRFEIYWLYPLGLKVWTKDKLETSIGGIRRDEPGEVEKGPLENRRKDDEDFLKNAYPLHISKDHEGYRFIRAVADAGTTHGVKILFYIAPVNHEYVEKAGYLDRGTFEAAKRTIIEATRGDGIYCIDLSKILGDEDFSGTYPNDHYHVHGRKKLADKLAPKVLEILAEEDVHMRKSSGQKTPY